MLLKSNYFDNSLTSFRSIAFYHSDLSLLVKCVTYPPAPLNGKAARGVITVVPKRLLPDRFGSWDVPSVWGQVDFLCVFRCLWKFQYKKNKKYLWWDVWDTWNHLGTILHKDRNIKKKLFLLISKCGSVARTITNFDLTFFVSWCAKYIQISTCHLDSFGIPLEAPGG